VNRQVCGVDENAPVGLNFNPGGGYSSGSPLRRSAFHAAFLLVTVADAVHFVFQ